MLTTSTGTMRKGSLIRRGVRRELVLVAVRLSSSNRNRHKLSNKRVLPLRRSSPRREGKKAKRIRRVAKTRLPSISAMCAGRCFKVAIRSCSMSTRLAMRSEPDPRVNFY